MFTTSTKSTFVTSVIAGTTAAWTQVALAAGKCSVNGEEVPCEQIAGELKGLLGWGIGIFIALAVFGLWATVFWIMMLVHAAKHNVDNKAMWIILMVFTGIVGAVIYYFVEKRKMDKQMAMPGMPTTPTNPPAATV